MTTRNCLTFQFILIILCNVQLNIALDVIIIGSGASGIAAATQLNSYGIKNKILEARNRIGGRINTNTEIFGYPVELGAIYITQQPDNPIIELAKKYNIRQMESNSNKLIIFTEQDNQVSNLRHNNKLSHKSSITKIHINIFLERINVLIKKFFTFITTTKTFHKNTTVRKSLNMFLKSGLSKSDILIMKYTSTYLNFSLNNKKVKDLIGSINLKRNIFFSGELKLTPDGYINILKPEADKLDIQFNTVVQSIKQDEHKIIITDQNSNTYSAEYVIITVPLGYLKKDLITFIPELSLPKKEAIKQLGFFNMNKVFVEFEEKFWSDEHHEIYVYEPLLLLDACNFHHINGKNLLIFFIDEDSYEKIKYLTMEELNHLVMSTLRRAYPNENIKIKKLYRTNWNDEPFTYGSFSEYSGDESLRRRFMEPEGRLIFAGEHTSPDFNSFVYGAYMSGLRAANQIQNIYLLNHK